MTHHTSSADVAGQLQPLLVDLIALTLNAKQAHWHVQGRHFVPVHEQLDGLVADTRRFSDDVAERVVALGSEVDGRPHAVAEAGNDIPSGFLADDKVVAVIVEHLDAIIARAREAVAALDDIDLVSQDLVIETVSVLEKHRWMFAAQVT